MGSSREGAVLELANAERHRDRRGVHRRAARSDAASGVVIREEQEQGAGSKEQPG